MTAAKKKRSSPTPLLKRTMELYRKGFGFHVEKVERHLPKAAGKVYNHRAGKEMQAFFLTTRKDLFEGIDILAFHFDSPGVLGIQVCHADRFADHLKKLLASPVLKDWVRCEHRELVIVSWRKSPKKRGGKQLIWKPSYQYLTLEMFEGRVSVGRKEKPKEPDPLVPPEPSGQLRLLKGGAA